MKYALGADALQPYVGGDIQVIGAYVREAGGIAAGVRARGGVDYLLTETFGLNLNLAVGYWSGEQFANVQRDMAAKGLTPQLSMGTLFAF